MVSNSGYSPSKQAVSAYKSNAQLGMSEQELMAQVLRKAVGHMLSARDFYLERKLELMVEQSSKAIHILDILRGELLGGDALKDPEAAPAAGYLIKTYADLIIRLGNVLLAKPPENEFNAIADKLKEIYLAWLPEGSTHPTAGDGLIPAVNVAG